jgi:hypothetical protein
MSLLEPIVTIGLLPDGRVGAENARHQGEVTREELREIPAALRVWWSLMWELHFPGETPEVNW